MNKTVAESLVRWIPGMRELQGLAQPRTRSPCAKRTSAMSFRSTEKTHRFNDSRQPGLRIQKKKRDSTSASPQLIVISRPVLIVGGLTQ